DPRSAGRGAQGAAHRGPRKGPQITGETKARLGVTRGTLIPSPTGPRLQVRQLAGPPGAGWYPHRVRVRTEDCRYAPAIGAASEVLLADRRSPAHGLGGPRPS